MLVMTSPLHFYSKSGTIWEFLRVSNVDNLVVEHFSNLYQIEVSVTSRKTVCFVHIITVVTQSNLCLPGITQEGVSIPDLLKLGNHLSFTCHR